MILNVFVFFLITSRNGFMVRALVRALHLTLLLYNIMFLSSESVFVVVHLSPRGGRPVPQS